MNYIERHVSDSVFESLQPGKVILLTGARRTGKTHLIKHLSTRIEENKLMLNGEDSTDCDLFEPLSKENYKLNFGSYQYIFIDEAQMMPEVGKKLKFLVDNLPEVKVLATGSSAFNLHQQFGQPLTGRKKTFHLYPISVQEFRWHENINETQGRLNDRLIYGSYPELTGLNSRQLKEDYLHELGNDYLFKDILAFDGIKNADIVRNLLRLIAFQTGHEISLNELSRQLQIHKDTVARYLDLLSKVFVIFKLEGFSKNLRKEITKMSRWYFYDNGVRNLLLRNFTPVDLRNDTGQLWENYIISERVKYLSYQGMHHACYFWRTYDQQEIDWIEEHNQELHAYEMKWNPKRQVKAPASWKKAYPDAKFDVINPKNYLGWLSQ
ncbi:MAG: ATP-binding protein [Bacteroidales bacterium]